MKVLYLSLSLTCCLLFAPRLNADGPGVEVSQFRGTQGNGVVLSKQATEWSSGKNLAWSTKVDGGGWSSSVMVGDRVFVTLADSDD